MNKLKNLIKTYKIKCVDLAKHVGIHHQAVSIYANGQRRITYKAKKKFIRDLYSFSQETQNNMKHLQTELKTADVKEIISKYKIKKSDLCKYAKIDRATLLKFLNSDPTTRESIEKKLIEGLKSLAQDIVKNMTLLEKELKNWSKIDDTDEDI